MRCYCIVNLILNESSTFPNCWKNCYAFIKCFEFFVPSTLVTLDRRCFNKIAISWQNEKIANHGEFRFASGGGKCCNQQQTNISNFDLKRRLRILVALFTFVRVSPQHELLFVESLIVAPRIPKLIIPPPAFLPISFPIIIKENLQRIQFPFKRQQKYFHMKACPIFDNCFQMSFVSFLPFALTCARNKWNL